MVEWLGPLQTGLAVLWYGVSLLVHVLYIVVSPLLYPVYLSFSVVAFLLSPIWYMTRACLGLGFLVTNLVARLKYLYIYLACAAVIGICAGIALHGTSSMVFLLLGVHPSQQTLPPLPPPAPPQDELQTEPDSNGTYSEAGSSSHLSSGSSSFLSRRRGKEPVYHRGALDGSELYENQWRLLGSSGSKPTPLPLTLKPRKKFRGLLAQTIHEESSESDSL